MALVEFEQQAGVAIMTFNRPESLNALSPALFIELREQIDRINGLADHIGCVILRGEGRAFSAGNDLKAIGSGDAAPSRHFQAETLDAIEGLPQPVIASVQGHCYTGALEVALACDLMICGESAKFCDTHGKWGMSPTWGMSQRLPRRIGLIRAKEIMFSGRVVTAEEAVRIGLANKVVPDEALADETIALASALLENSWFTLVKDKELVNAGVNMSLAEGLAFERANSPGAGPDMRARVAKFTKR